MSIRDLSRTKKERSDFALDRKYYKSIIVATYDLRKHMAKLLKNARKGNFSLKQTQDVTAGLISNCEPMIKENAKDLHEKVVNQLSCLVLRSELKKVKKDISKIKISRINTRIFLPAVKL